MSIELQAVALRSPEPRRAAHFWGSLLGRVGRTDGDGILLAGGSGQVGLRFDPGPPHGEEKNRLHLHLVNQDRGQQDTIAASLELGGRLLGNGHVPHDSHAIMADVVGDEFCVIEDTNSFLAGCGPLGEITCDGTRETGIFWGRALGWTLVWEEGEETAIQSPTGGTKISWSGDLVNPDTDRDRQSFVVTVAREQVEDEIARLSAIGAVERTDSSSGDRVLDDPDGNAFVVRPLRALRSP